MEKIELVDYGDRAQASVLIDLLNAYAEDPMGGNAPLTPYTKANLVERLKSVPGAFSLIAYSEATPVGLANCFEGFSTFSCKPLVNIHDLYIVESRRGLGLCSKLLQKVEMIAIERNCCKVTLEVLSGNDRAKKAYQKFGFEGYALDESVGSAEFWQKKL